MVVWSSRSCFWRELLFYLKKGKILLFEEPIGENFTTAQETWLKEALKSKAITKGMYDILIAWIDADNFSNLTFDLDNWVRVTTVHVGIQDFCISQANTNRAGN